MRTFNYDARVACQKSDILLQKKTVRFSQFSIYVWRMGRFAAFRCLSSVQLANAANALNCTSQIGYCPTHTIRTPPLASWPVHTWCVISHRLLERTNNMWKLNFV